MLLRRWFRLHLQSLLFGASFSMGACFAGPWRAAGVVWNMAGAGPSGFSEVPEKSWRALGLEGVGKRQDFQTLGPWRAAGVVWNLAAAGPSGLSEVPEKSWRELGPVVELPGTFPATSRSSWKPLGEVGKRWIDKNNSLEAPRSRWIDENSVLESRRSRWIDKTSSFRGPWSATRLSSAASTRYPGPHQTLHFLYDSQFLRMITQYSYY